MKIKDFILILVAINISVWGINLALDQRPVVVVDESDEFVFTLADLGIRTDKFPIHKPITVVGAEKGFSLDSLTESQLSIVKNYFESHLGINSAVAQEGATGPNRNANFEIDFVGYDEMVEAVIEYFDKEDCAEEWARGEHCEPWVPGWDELCGEEFNADFLEMIGVDNASQADYALGMICGFGDGGGDTIPDIGGFISTDVVVDTIEGLISGLDPRSYDTDGDGDIDANDDVQGVIVGASGLDTDGDGDIDANDDIHGAVIQMSGLDTDGDNDVDSNDNIAAIVIGQSNYDTNNDGQINALDGPTALLAINPSMLDTDGDGDIDDQDDVDGALIAFTGLDTDNDGDIDDQDDVDGALIGASGFDTDNDGDIDSQDDIHGVVLEHSSHNTNGDDEINILDGPVALAAIMNPMTLDTDGDGDIDDQDDVDGAVIAMSGLDTDGDGDVDDQDDVDGAIIRASGFDTDVDGDIDAQDDVWSVLLQYATISKNLDTKENKLADFIKSMFGVKVASAQGNDNDHAGVLGNYNSGNGGTTFGDFNFGTDGHGSWSGSYSGGDGGDGGGPDGGADGGGEGGGGGMMPFGGLAYGWPCCNGWYFRLEKCGCCKQGTGDDGTYMAYWPMMKKWYVPTGGHAVLGNMLDYEDKCKMFVPYICNSCNCEIKSDYLVMWPGVGTSSSRPDPDEVTDECPHEGSGSGMSGADGAAGGPGAGDGGPGAGDGGPGAGDGGPGAGDGGDGSFP